MGWISSFVCCTLYILYIVVLYKASSRKFSRRFPTVPEGSGRLLGNSGQNAAQVQRAESLLEESPISLDEFHFLLVSYCPIWYSTDSTSLNYSIQLLQRQQQHHNSLKKATRMDVLADLRKIRQCTKCEVLPSYMFQVACFSISSTYALHALILKVYVHYMYYIILSPKDRIV